MMFIYGILSRKRINLHTLTKYVYSLSWKFSKVRENIEESISSFDSLPVTQNPSELYERSIRNWHFTYIKHTHTHISHMYIYEAFIIIDFNNAEWQKLNLLNLIRLVKIERRFFLFKR